jgi:aldose 1-epimerase
VNAGVTLRAGALEAVVLPEIGGAIAEFAWRRSGEKLPLFRPLAPRSAAGDATPPDPNELACYPLIPWSNRIGHGAFPFGGKTYRVAPTRAHERYPIHGDGWLRKWRVVHRSDHALSLDLASEVAPFVYRGMLEYALRETTLDVRLSVQNLGAEALPFGLGLHPWFVRTPQVRLRAEARGIWQVADDLLPVAHAPVPADLDFAQPRPLPARLVDNSFTGWSGSAEITWEDIGVQLSISTTPPLEYFQLYAPPGRDYFCFEPISHPANAFNLPAPHTGAGLTVLAPGQSTAIAVSFSAVPA